MVESVRAAVLTAPGRMEIREFPYPTLGKGAIILRMETAGICGTDKHTYRGENVQYAGTPAESRTPFPIIPGHENVGVIEEIDEAARERGDFYGHELRVGDRVTFCPDLVCGRCWYCRNTFGYPWCEHVKGYGNALSCNTPPHLFGGWAEYVYLLPGVFVYKVPEGMPLEVAVLAELFTVSCALERALATCLPGDGFGGAPTVVVQGVGPLGLCCLIKARILGAGEIIATDLSPFRLRMAEEFGADGALNVAETEVEERVEFVRQRTQGRGADIVIECAGVPAALPEGLEIVRKGGLQCIASLTTARVPYTIRPEFWLAAMTDCLRRLYLCLNSPKWKPSPASCARTWWGAVSWASSFIGPAPSHSPRPRRSPRRSRASRSSTRHVGANTCCCPWPVEIP